MNIDMPIIQDNKVEKVYDRYFITTQFKLFSELNDMELRNELSLIGLELVGRSMKHFNVKSKGHWDGDIVEALKIISKYAYDLYTPISACIVEKPTNFVTTISAVQHGIVSVDLYDEDSLAKEFWIL